MNSASFSAGMRVRRCRGSSRSGPSRAELTERPVVRDVVGRSRSSSARTCRPSARRVVPGVEGAVERAHQRQEIVGALDRIGRDMDVLGGVERHRHPDGRREVARPQVHARTTVSASTAPRDVRTPVTRRPSSVSPSTRTPSDRDAAVVRPFANASAAWPGFTVPSPGWSSPPTPSAGEWPDLGDLVGVRS